MKTISLLIGLLFSSVAHSALPAYGLYIMQADVGGEFFWGRYWTPASPTSSYILIVALGNVATNTATVIGTTPAGLYAKLRTQNNTGTPTFTARPGSERQE